MAAAKKEQPPEPAGIVTLEQAGKLLEIGPERIKVLMRQGYIARDKPGRVSLVSAVRGYIRSVKEAASRTTKTSADSRVRDARAKEIEMRNSVRLRELIPIEDATAALDFLVGTVRERMNSIPARVTRDIELRRKIEAEVNAAQVQIAEALRAATGVARKGGDLPHAGGDN
jgi:hypothetical protein